MCNMHLSFIKIPLSHILEQVFFYIISERMFYVKRNEQKAIEILLNFNLFCSKVLHILQLYYII